LAAQKMKKQADLFYLLPPREEMTIDEFREYSMDRLIVLRKVEELSSRNAGFAEFSQEVERSLALHLPTNREGHVTSSRADVISHFALRLAYCSSMDLQHWFVTQEAILFRHRLSMIRINAGIRGVELFAKSVGFNYDVMGEEEKLEKIRLLRYNLTAQEFNTCKIFKVPFVEATELIRQKEVVLRGGFALVPSTKLSSVLVSAFRKNLKINLMRAMNNNLSLTSDVRIGPVLGEMRQDFAINAFSSMKIESTITANNVDQHARQNMPLCARQLHIGLKRDHKLKYFGRQQYGLFLKGAGLSMEEALLFFKTEFTKIMSADDFQKQYSYNIRHQYGKEGGRINYKPYACSKIIMGTAPGAGDHHGCPFKHYDLKHVENMLEHAGVQSGEDMQRILMYSRDLQPTKACLEHFRVTHPGSEGAPGGRLTVNPDVMAEVGNHPNAWFAASNDFHTRKLSVASGGGGGDGGGGDGGGGDGGGATDKNDDDIQGNDDVSN